MKNKRRVRESLSQVRIKEVHMPSHRSSSMESGSIRHSIESQGGISRMIPELRDLLSEFKIERNLTTYRVNVQERKNYEGRPL